MKPRIHLAAALFSVLFAACEFGSSPGGGTGVDGLSGIIVNAGGEPVVGARVRAYPAPGALGKSARAMEARPESTLTAADGSYRFKTLAKGTYNLEAAFSSNDTLYALFHPGIAFEKKLNLGIDTLRRAADVRVRVLNAQGAPVAGAECSLVGTSRRAFSDASGDCRLEGVAPGAYTVQISAGDGAAQGSLTLAEGSPWEGQVNLSAERGGEEVVPLDWRLTRISEGFTAWLPPDMLRLDETRDGARVRARYASSGLAMNVTWGSWSRIPEEPSSAGYFQDTLRLDSMLVWRIVGWTLPDNTLSYPVQYRYFRGLQIEAVHRPEVDVGPPVLVIEGQGVAAVDAEALTRILRTVRYWDGTTPVRAPPSLPPRPTLHLPTSASATETDSVRFSWEAPLDTSTHFYRLQVSEHMDFSSLWVNDSAARLPAQSSTRLERRHGPFESGKTYYWRVLGVNGHGETASTPRLFTTEAVQPDSVVPVFPVSNAVGVSRAPLLEWGVYYNYEGIEGYRVQLATDSLFANPALDSVVTHAQYLAASPGTYPGFQVEALLAAHTRYFWRVITLGRLGRFTISPVSAFTTQ